MYNEGKNTKSLNYIKFYMQGESVWDTKAIP